MDSRSEVNAIHLFFAKQLGLLIRATDVGTPKIGGIMLDTYRMVVAAFLIVDKRNQVSFFEETFFVANVSSEVVFWMLFLTLSNVNINFLGRKLLWRTYIIKKALPTTKSVELVEKKEFAAVILKPEYETYVIHIVFLSSNPLIASLGSSPFNIYPFQRPQISSLITEKALRKVSDKYANFADVFSLDLVSKLSKHLEINDHAIELVDGQQPPYKPVYSLSRYNWRL